MNTAKLITLGILRGSGVADTSASFAVTTTGAQTLTINGLTVSASTTVNWGDGSSNDYTGSGARTHNYAGAGTWTVRIMQPENVTLWQQSSTTVALVINSANVKRMTNITSFQLSMSSNLTGVINSADLSAWRPTTFTLINLPVGVTGAFNSVDVSAWRPTTFSIITSPTGFTGAWDFAYLSNWNPTTYNMYFASTFSYTITAANLSGWVGLANSSQSWNAYTQAQVDAVLLGLYTAAQSRTATGGTLDVGGNNAAPSGTLAAMCPPTTGKAAAFELENDSCGVIAAGKEWPTVTITP